ncbi:MAG TPA: phosphotransferase family protein [Caulobacteraceae bacterium]|jgi:aminoglycoside phosphotransferase (APT) family kinase protein|nr:phosphotransferase family protein [Caulobacteraceae bacterium]
MSGSLSDALGAYLSRVWGSPVAVEGLSRISGGASRETYRFDAVREGKRRGYILRRDPPGSLIDTDRTNEFEAIAAFAGRAVAAPETILLEADGAELTRPFFIMGRIDGGSPASPFAPDPYGAHAGAIGEQFFTILGRIAREPIEPMGLTARGAPQPDACWKRELDYWAGVIEADEIHPQPIVRAAIRRLYRNPPAPARRVSLVHGDYRSGNFLHDGAGKIIAVLDWEMAHLGDPLEDLAWALDPLWTRPGETRVSGMLPPDEGLAIWSRESGIEIDREALAWWRLFASVKGQAIWISSAKAWADGGMAEPILAFSGWYTARAQDVILARHLIGGVAA